MNGFMKMWFTAFVLRVPGGATLQESIQKMRLKRWNMAGCPLPPPHKVKQDVLRRIIKEHGLEAFVETGTLFGDMLYALRDDFSEGYSIELSDVLYRWAVKRFRKDSRIKLINGDSGAVLHELVPKLSKPVLFWLDGHYSGGVTATGDEVTPIFKELEAVFSCSAPYVVAIDDARLFGTDPAYPSKEELIRYVQSKNDLLSVTTDQDIILVAPRKQSRLAE